MGATPQTGLTKLAPPTPADEGERLAALTRLCLLDTKPEESFDRVTRLAAKTLDVPIVLVSLVDEARQWFKSRFGLAAAQTPRDISFCGHVVYAKEPLVVDDAAQDPRFSGNPLVTAAPHIRAYLGIPLFTLSGQAIGTLCAIDTRPRKFGVDDIAALADFAQIVSETLHSREQSELARDAIRVANEREQIYRDTFQLGDIGIVHTALSGQMIRVNPQMSVMLGYSNKEIISKTFIDITYPDDVAQNMELFLQLAAGKLDRYRMQKRFIRKDGTILWANLSVVLKRGGEGESDYIIATVEDISELKQKKLELIEVREALKREVANQEQRLAERGTVLQETFNRMLEAERSLRIAEGRARHMANSVPAMIGYWNSNLRCEFANAAYRDWFGLTPDELIGIEMPDLMGEELFKLNEPYVRGVLAGKTQHFERRLVKQDGTVSYVDARYEPDRDEAGAVIGFYVLVTDITPLRLAHEELAASNAQLAQENTTDFLTGIANRRVFSKRSEEATKHYRVSQKMYGLILIDMDDFKRINDHFGHDVGDDVLRSVGRILRQELRGGEDLAARLGGEEFAILCFGDVTEKSVMRLADRIRAQIEKEGVPSGSGLVNFTGSFGVALCSERDSDWKDIYGRADCALYKAKAEGKNRVAITPIE